MTGARAKEEVILAAAASLFGERSPETVPMEEIARRAGVAKGTLYLYFDSKEELVRSLLGSRLDSLIRGIETRAATPEEPATRVRGAVEFLFRTQLGSGDWFRMRRRAESCPATGDFLRAREQRLHEAFCGIVAQATPPGRDPSRMCDLLQGTVEAAVLRCLEDPGVDPEREFRGLWRFVRRALDLGELAGRTVLVTREEDDEGPLSGALRSRGAQVLRVPLLKTLPPEDPAALRREGERLGSYDWVLLTSARAARALAEAAAPGGASPRFAVVGEATARRLRERGWEPAVVGRGGGAALVEEVRTRGSLEGAQVLFPAADRASGEGVRALEAAGARVRVVAAYRTVRRKEAAEELVRVLAARPPDAIAFTSPSAVEAFVEATGRPSSRSGEAPLVVAIGPTTAQSLHSVGFGDVRVASRPEFEALAEAIARGLGS